MILLANEVMQEGLDLHENPLRFPSGGTPAGPSTRAWSGTPPRSNSAPASTGASIPAGIAHQPPAKDRGGRHPGRALPSHPRDIDERLFRTVKRREKWLEFLLGAAPNFSEYVFADEEPLPCRTGWAQSSPSISGLARIRNRWSRTPFGATAPKTASTGRRSAQGGSGEPRRRVEERVPSRSKLPAPAPDESKRGSSPGQRIRSLTRPEAPR
jgi:hypothetical protein